jgi:hypothetical protein
VVRLSIGIEDVADIIADLDQALVEIRAFLVNRSAQTAQERSCPCIARVAARTRRMSA